MKIYVVPLLAAISFVAAVGWTYSVRPRHEPTLPAAPPPESTSDKTIAAVGLVEPESEHIELSCAVSGMVTSLYVKAGDRVSKGQRLFAVDDRDLIADRGVKQAALGAARAKVRKLEEAPRPEEVSPAEAKVAEAEALLADARVQMNLIEGIEDPRAVKREDVERRRLNFQAAAARLEQAKRDLALLTAGTWAPDLEIARAELAQAAAAVRQDEINLERLTVTAPVDGTILQNNVRPGQFAQCGAVAEPLMVVGGGTSVHVRADIDENDAWRVTPGAAAVAHVRGNSAITYPLAFVRLEPYVVPKKSLTGNATERVDTRVLQVIYRITSSAPKVFDGQQMDVYINRARERRP
ncbi:MAG TPA: efflux RND transporter periplasmic adaptor subunit [Vicinamibacterales bacterium]|nr:efflux RND transporter periplasmic adaptor subunit [Vicinamibacterales bacterium]